MQEKNQIPYRKPRGCFDDSPSGQAEYESQFEENKDNYEKGE